MDSAPALPFTPGPRPAATVAPVMLGMPKEIDGVVRFSAHSLAGLVAAVSAKAIAHRCIITAACWDDIRTHGSWTVMIRDTDRDEVRSFATEGACASMLGLAWSTCEGEDRAVWVFSADGTCVGMLSG